MTAHPLADPLLAALVAAQEQHKLFAPLPTTVVVGVSGGADSVCLLHALALLAPRWALTLHVAHVDHSLRPGSAEDALFVRNLAAALRLPFHGLTLAPGELAPLPGGLEAAARLVRHRFLHATALAVTPPGQVPHVALAHHAEDQAETLLLQLVRGSGLRGLGAMRPVVTLQVGAEEGTPLRVVRPYLQVHRAELRAYLVRHKLIWREDPTNTDLTIARNRVRHAILPQLAQINPGVVDRLGRTAELLAGEAARLDLIDAALLEQLRFAPISPERILLDLDGLRRLSTPEQRGVLRHALAHLMPATGGGASGAPSFQHIESLRAHLSTVIGATGPQPLVAGLAWSVTGAHQTPHWRLSLHHTDALPFPPDHPYLGDTWRATQGCLPLSPGADVIVGGWGLTCTLTPVALLPSHWRQNRDPWRAYLDAERAAPCLTTPVAGMRMAPLGMAGRTRALGDLFTDRKTPVSLRSGWPLVVDAASGALLWVCGLQPAEVGRVTAATKSVLCLAWLQQR